MGRDTRYTWRRQKEEERHGIRSIRIHIGRGTIAEATTFVEERNPHSRKTRTVEAVHKISAEEAEIRRDNNGTGRRGEEEDEESGKEEGRQSGEGGKEKTEEVGEGIVFVVRLL